MSMKTKVTKDNYKEIVLKRAIILCWILLVICFIIKICGGNFFNIVCNNEKFIDFCEKVDKSVIKYIIYYMSFVISSYMLFLMIKPETKFLSLKTLLFIIVCSIIWVYKLLVDLKVINISTLLVNIIDILLLFILLYVFSKKFLLSLFAVGLLFIFSILSALTKNIGLTGVITDSYLITNIFLIDYYIMIILSLLYSKLKYLRR